MVDPEFSRAAAVLLLSEEVAQLPYEIQAELRRELLRVEDFDDLGPDALAIWDALFADSDWKRFDPNQLRDPGGEHGGEWVRDPFGAIADLPGALDDITEAFERLSDVGPGRPVTLDHRPVMKDIPKPTSTKEIECSRCGGRGEIPQFAHVAGGICFACHGAGSFQVSPDAQRARTLREEQAKFDYYATYDTVEARNELNNARLDALREVVDANSLLSIRTNAPEITDGGVALTLDFVAAAAGANLNEVTPELYADLPRLLDAYARSERFIGRRMPSRFRGTDSITGERFDKGDEIFYGGQLGQTVLASTIERLLGDEKRYNPNQPRDRLGRWTRVGGVHVNLELIDEIDLPEPFWRGGGDSEAPAPPGTVADRVHALREDLDAGPIGPFSPSLIHPYDIDEADPEDQTDYIHRGVPGKPFRDQHKLIMQAGGEVDDEISRRIGPRAAELENEEMELVDRFERALSNVGDADQFDYEMSDEMEEAIATRAAIKEIRAARLEMERDATLEVLKEIREMGGRISIYNYEGMSVLTDEDRESGIEGRRLVAEAEQYFPRDWIERINQHPATVSAWHDPGTRGSHNHDETANTITLTFGGGQPPATRDHLELPVAIHEITHAVETAMPEIRAAEWSFLNRRARQYPMDMMGSQARFFARLRGGAMPRTPPALHQITDDMWEGDLPPPMTMNEATGTQMYAESEMTIPDEFVDPYYGMVYGGFPSMDNHYETMTATMSDLFTGDNGAAMDDDARRFVLGLLAIG